MQLQDSILGGFATKGYSIQSRISRKQLIKVITLLVNQIKKQKNAHKSISPIDQAILNQIWRQTETRLGQQNPPRLPQQVILQDVIQSLLDAIQILSNRITQCSSAIQQMIARRKQLQNEKDYTRAEMMHHKMVTLNGDLMQFQKDLLSLTYPFNHDITDLTNKLTTIRKYSGEKSIAVVSKPSLQIQINQIDNNNRQIKTKSKKLQLQQYLKDNEGQQLDKEGVQDGRNVTLWMLGLLMFMECTLVLVKYSFVNLMVFLIGFFVLLQQYKPSMTKVSFYSCLFSIFMDAIWLLINSMEYINPSINSGLTLFNKKYQLYVWFLTVVQLFVKLIYLCLLKRYQFLQTVFLQQQDKQQNGPDEQQSFQSKNRQIVDHYIPNMKDLLKIQKTQPLQS